jgi:phosphate transport system substrate-binding protein
MTRETQSADVVSRRNFILGTGAAGAVALAGCSGSNASTPSGDSETTTPGNAGGGAKGPTQLSAEGSSTVYPISNKGSSYWNGNPPADDAEYWGPDQYNIDTEMHLADYFASQYGFEPTEKRSNAPFSVSVGLSHSGTGCKSVRDGLVDIGNSSGPITAELGLSDAEANENYVDHVVGRDGQPVFLSQDVFDAGVETLTGEEVRKIYQGEINNWQAVGGNDQEIYVVGRAEGSGTDTAFRLNMLGDADAPMQVDTRKGQNQQVQTVLQQNDGAIGYMALAFQSEGIQPVGINFDGTLYEPNKDAEHTIFDSDYPLNRDLHMYTRKTDEHPEGTSMKEAAFINMFLTEFGQKRFVEDVGYIPLPTKDIEAERAKLPDTV